jgi:hypothetical protein
LTVRELEEDLGIPRTIVSQLLSNTTVRQHLQKWENSEIIYIYIYIYALYFGC